MSDLLAVQVNGTPGPKGSVNAFCVRCARARLKSAVVVKEESEVGVAFRKVLARHLAGHRPAEPYSGPMITTVWTHVERLHVVRNGVKQPEWRPTHAEPYPIHQQSGDIEKFVRVLHDAAQDAHVLSNDSIVVDLHAYKRWADAATPPGMVIEMSPKL